MSIFLDIAEIVALQRSYAYDAGNRITRIIDGKAGLNYRYVHDKLDRLTKQTLAGFSLEYAYDRNSNRTKKAKRTTTPYSLKNTLTPIETTSNKLQNVTYDASGRILKDAKRQYGYDDLGRIRFIRHNGWGMYNYNALGQRVEKYTSKAGRTLFVYDEQGKLIGEYTQTNKPIREYVYLGNMPVGMFTKEKQGELLQIHTDHLGTPRAVTDKTKAVLWRWEGDQFGTSSPQIEKIKLPLRHAGQYFDSESGLFYNWHRYYDPSSGRYLRSDPLGLSDGTNPYGYVHANPTAKVDPDGQLAFLAAPAAGVLGGGAAGGWGASLGGLAAAGGVAGALAMAFGGDDAGDDAGEACPPRPNNQDPCKGLRKQLAEHERKLAEYMGNPFGMDNKGHLSKALKNNPDLFWKIRAGRIQSLLNQIENFRRQLAACEAKYGKGG